MDTVRNIAVMSYGYEWTPKNKQRHPKFYGSVPDPDPYVFGLPDLAPLVKGKDPDTDTDPSIINQKL